MKNWSSIILLLITSMSEAGCSSVGAYITTHQVTIAAVSVTAGATSAMTSTAVNVMTLEKDFKPASGVQ